MNIAEVIGWKFNHQSGMRCEEVDGVLTITEFPGGIPTQADQYLWAVEYSAFEAKEKNNAAIQDKLDKSDLKIIRALAEKDTVRIEAHKTAQAALRAQLW